MSENRQNARQIDMNLVYKDVHGALSTVTSTVELYHDQFIKLVSQVKEKDETIMNLHQQIMTLQKNKIPNMDMPEKVPNKPQSKK